MKNITGMSCVSVYFSLFFVVFFVFARLSYTREKRTPIKTYFGMKYVLAVLWFNLLNPVDFWSDFWPGFWPAPWGPEKAVYSSTGTENYSVITVLPGQRK